MYSLDCNKNHLVFHSQGACRIGPEMYFFLLLFNLLFNFTVLCNDCIFQLYNHSVLRTGQKNIYQR